MATPNMGFYPPTGLYGASSFVDDDAALAQSFHRKTSPIPTAGSSHAASSPPPAGWGSPSVDTDGGSDFSASSPPASDDGFGAAAHPMDAPGASSGYARREDWDLLSEMLVDDAIPGLATLPAQSFLPGNSFGAYDAFGAPPPTKQPHAAMYLPQHHQHQQPQASLVFAPPAPFQHHAQRQIPSVNHHQHSQHSQQLRRSAAPMPAGFMDALLLQDDALLASRAKAAGVGSPQTTDLFPPVAMPALPATPPQPLSATSECSDSDALSPAPSPQATKATRKAPPPASVKQEPLSAEEAKKLRRRSQIASSVQRHREKKKCLVATLKQDLSTLTTRLESLRSERKVLHSNNETLVAWEEEAITQRRKRKQSEELNQRMKKALFQQTCFLMGMRSIMTNVPAPRELHIHDWLHSYTVLTARERSARQKEYLGYFSDSKVDMARQIVLRETDAFATRLTLSNPYFSEIRILHDGTEVIHHEEDVRLKSELSEETEYVVPGTGQVVKKYTSMFLFEERGNCTMEAFKHVALEATKAVGVFWPSPGYSSHALDTVELDASSQLIFSDLHGSMSIVDDKLTSDDQDVQLESRMICRVQHTDDDTTIAWDYADKDELYPIEGDRAIRRDSCGAAIVRREPGGKISFRSVCVKMFGPLDSHETASNQDKALTQRRISLQASELERQNQKCTRSVYESLAGAFTRSVSIQSSA